MPDVVSLQSGMSPETVRKQTTEEAVLAGFPISPFDRAAFMEFCRGRILRKEPCWIVTLNLEMFSRCRINREYRALLKRADAFIADGMPLVWGSRLKRGTPALPERLAGADLAEDLLRLVPAEKTAIIGGKDPAAALRISGLADPSKAYIFSERVEATEQQADFLAEELNRRGSQVVFIGLGVGKQDKVAELLRERIEQGILIGVGGTFDMLAGEVRRAPVWVRKAGFEWLFRLLQEPKRLAYRYLVLYWVGGLSLAGEIVASWFSGGRRR